MDKEKRKSLELAISAYRLEAARDVFELVKGKKAEDLKNGANNDYFTHLPVKCINGNTQIQIVGTECPDVFMIWRIEPNQTDRIGKFYRPQEVDNFIREMKTKSLINR